MNQVKTKLLSWEGFNNNTYWYFKLRLYYEVSKRAYRDLVPHRLTDIVIP